ncbi:MAG TPA: hypothetical protein P5038_11740, partial [Candidatus Paceibacterota bacterium]|nr:hypothetical protein [Candidatus Paceibacterota bacterium]
ALAAVGLLGVATSARATIIIDYPMNYTTPNVVGTATGLAGDNTGTDALLIAQKLLDMGKGEETTINDRVFKTNTEYDYDYNIVGSGPTFNVIFRDNPKTPEVEEPNVTVYYPAEDGEKYLYIASGYQYVIGKYDGKNAGWILFHLGGQDGYIPVVSQNFWGEGTDQYEISNFTPIPEPTSVIAGALLLLPFAASTVRYVRRNRKA